MHGFRIGCALVLFLASGCTRRPREAVTQSFEKSDEGWLPYGTDASVEVTHDPSLVKSGTSALAIHYRYNPGQYGSAVLPLEAGQFAQTPGLQFWIRTDMATAVIVVLSEKPPGGYYSSWFWCPKDEWQHIALTPSDFILDTGPDDPKDPDGRLDLDRVNGIGISDLGQAFQSIGVEPAYPLVVERGSGAHTMALDDFTLGAASDSGPRRAARGVEGGFITWITTGGARLEIGGAGNPLHAPATQATYNESPGRYVLLAHTLANLEMRGASKVVLPIASAKNARFLVYLEENLPGKALGPRYRSSFDLRAGVAENLSLAFSSFAFDPTGPPDPDGRLDAGRLKSISLIDITAAQSEAAGANTVWIGALRPQ